MVESAEARASQLRAMVVVTESAESIDVQQMRGAGIINFPSDAARSTQMRGAPVFRQIAQVRASQLRFMVVAAGRATTPLVRDWTYTLDGHDFYILQTRLETIVFDLTTQRSFVWGTGNSALWRAHAGLIWERPLFDAFAASNIVAGDDTLGVLYLLNPNASVDDNPDDSRADNPIPYQRIVYGQIAVRGRYSVPCYGVEVYGSIGAIDNNNLTSVSLSTSDDRGNTFNQQGVVNVSRDVFDQRVEWLSIGQMQAPGRLFRVEDFGALARIDDFRTPDLGEG